jgi:2-oxoglutarate ferredoxin oxidoreductase subunit alpha
MKGNEAIGEAAVRAGCLNYFAYPITPQSEVAEKYRNPVMILGDGLIGQMMEPVEFPYHLKSKPTNKNSWATNGMATRNSERRNLVKSLYLDPAELNRHNLNLKGKYARMQSEEVRYEAYRTDTDYQVLIVSYGTMSRVCRKAIDQVEAQGIDVGLKSTMALAYGWA